MGTNKGYLFRVCCIKGVNITGVWQRLRSRQRSGKLYGKKKKEGGFSCALVGSCWCAEAGGGLNRNRAPSVIGLGSIVSFLWLVLTWKQGQMFGKLTGLAQTLPALGWLLRVFWFGCLHWLVRCPWVQVLSRVNLPQSLYVVSLSALWGMENTN